MDRAFAKVMRQQLRELSISIGGMLAMLDGLTPEGTPVPTRGAEESQCDFIYRLLLTQTEPITVRAVAALAGMSCEPVRGVLYARRDLFQCIKVSPRRCVWAAIKPGSEVPA